MPNFLENLPKIQGALDWFRDYYKSPDGKAAMTIIAISLAFGFYHGSNRYDAGIAFQKKEDSIRIADKNEDIKQLKRDNADLTKRNIDQQERLENMDCNCKDEVLGYKNLFKSLQEETEQTSKIELEINKKEVQERRLRETALKEEKQKTKNLTNIKNNLK